MESEQRKKSLRVAFGLKSEKISIAEKSVKISLMREDKITPLIYEAETKIDIHTWITLNLKSIRESLKIHGGILLRNFLAPDVESMKAFVKYFEVKTINYTHRSSPRSEIAPNVYTSTDHPADQIINMHNELSYSSSWPRIIFFFCVQPAQEGGETPIVDSREVLKSLKAETVQMFEDKGIMYVRNLWGDEGLGLTWQEVFQTHEKACVEEECKKLLIDFQWKDNNNLKIHWKRPAIIRHPETDERIWFNHAFFFNHNAIDAELISGLQSSEIPFNTYYGDGLEIEKEVIDELRHAYEKNQILFKWHEGDILVLDNMLMAHGRNSFTGPRKILVTMADPFSI